MTGATHREHLQNLQEVLTCLEKAGLKLKKDKYAFMLPAVEYLGHEITEAGLKLTTEKVRALVEAPVPKDISQLRSFLGQVCQVHAKPVECSHPTETAVAEV